MTDGLYCFRAKVAERLPHRLFSDLAEINRVQIAHSLFRRSGGAAKWSFFLCVKSCGIIAAVN